MLTLRLMVGSISTTMLLNRGGFLGRCLRNLLEGGGVVGCDNGAREDNGDPIFFFSFQANLLLLPRSASSSSPSPICFFSIADLLLLLLLLRGNRFKLPLRPTQSQFSATSSYSATTSTTTFSDDLLQREGKKKEEVWKCGLGLLLRGKMSEEGTELRLKVAITSARPLGMLEAELNGMDGKVSLKSREKQRKEGRRRNR